MLNIQTATESQIDLDPKQSDAKLTASSKSSKAKVPNEWLKPFIKRQDKGFILLSYAIAEFRKDHPGQTISKVAMSRHIRRLAPERIAGTGAQPRISRSWVRSLVMGKENEELTGPMLVEQAKTQLNLDIMPKSAARILHEALGPDRPSKGRRGRRKSAPAPQ